MGNQSSYSDYWLGKLFDRYFEHDSNASSFAQTYSLIRLASVRRAISNFVCITTDKNINVFFNDDELKKSFTDVETSVVISSKINTKKDLDVSIGLALHEAVHIIKSDPTAMKLLMGRMPDDLKKPALEKGLRLSQIETYTRQIWGWIEDRYIDDWEWRNAPGYRGYYHALYDKYFYNKVVEDALQSKILRVPTLRAYKYRIYNIMNKGSDLNALPALYDIAKTLDLSHINRCESSYDRMSLAFDICKMIFENASTDSPIVSSSSSPGNTSGGHVTPSENDNELPDPGDEEVEIPNSDESDSKDDDVTQISNEPPGQKELDPKKENEENQNLVDGWGDTEDYSDQGLEKLGEALKNQDDFVRGDIKKEDITQTQKDLLDLIESTGIELVPVGGSMVGNIGRPPADCIVVKKMTHDLVFSSMFPLLHVEEDIKNPEKKPTPEIQAAVYRGIQMGRSLGRRLRIRNDILITKYPHLSNGKVDRRNLAALGCGLDDIFFKSIVGEYNNVSLHISVDASSSMSLSNKWTETMSMVVALCQATSQIRNIRTIVSFRTTVGEDHGGASFLLPYVVVAYDSRIDKMSKIRSLFPFIGPNGWTPEGLAFEAISNLFEKKMGDDYYFLNVSDGMPYMDLEYGAFGKRVRVSYTNDTAINHTRQEVHKIRGKGVKVLSYFIKTSLNEFTFKSEESVKQDFRTMYGRDSKFIDVSKVGEISRTMNEKFLETT